MYVVPRYVVIVVVVGRFLGFSICDFVVLETSDLKMVALADASILKK